MREDLLHFIWKTNKLPLKQLKTTKGEDLIVHQSGQHNYTAGPDFFNAKLEIDGQVWAGNVEMHLKASDWYAHGHETDSNYNNVILHVVWEDDVSVFRKDKTEIPTLALKELIPNTFLTAYKNLLYSAKKKFINCENDIALVNDFLFDSWLERLYVERLEQKATLIFDLLKTSNNDWEQVLFTLLLKNFGSKVNGEAFLSISKSLDFSIVKKLQNNAVALESVLMGMAGLLESDEIHDEYHKKLRKEFNFQKSKFSLNTLRVQKPEFFGLRPNNFPTIRLSQLANLYVKKKNLFSQLLDCSAVEDFYILFEAETSEYWTNHFTFGKESKSTKKRLTKNFIDLILINTIVPLQFAYAKSLGKDVNQQLIALMVTISVEKNNIIKRFAALGRKGKNAFESQATLQLYNQYCSENQCLKCIVGSTLLTENS